MSNEEHIARLTKYKYYSKLLNGALNYTPMPATSENLIIVQENIKEEIAQVITENLDIAQEGIQKEITNTIENILVEINKKEIDRLKCIQFIAWFFTLLMLFGIAFNGAIALLAALPTLPVYAFWILFGVVAVAAGWSEKQIFFNYIRKFCYQMFFIGPLQSIDIYILKREARNRYNKSIYDLTAAEAHTILTEHSKERLLKKMLVILAIPFAIAAGVGHAALLLHTSTLLIAMLHLTIGGALLACPYTAAIGFGIIFSIVMFMMIHRAIKKNIFAQIKKKIVDIFLPDPNDTSKHARAKHIAKCVILVLLVTLIVGLAITATVLTAGTWLDSSVKFFEYSLQLANTVANWTYQVGITIATILLITNVMFTMENSFNTLEKLAQTTLNSITTAFYEIKENPIKLVFLPFNLLTFTIHAACAAAIGIMANSSFISTSSRFLSTFIDVLTWVVPPALRTTTDAAPLLANQKKSEKKKSNNFTSVTLEIICDAGSVIATPFKCLWCNFFESPKEVKEKQDNSVARIETGSHKTESSEKEEVSNSSSEEDSTNTEEEDDSFNTQGQRSYGNYY